MTVIRPNSVSGINSITAQADEIKVFKSNGTQGGLIIGGANLNATTGISTILALNVTGNVSIAGTLTYQDVTNVDSLGIGTFRTGINVSAGQLDVGSNIKIGNAGVITATSFSGSGANLTGITGTTINNNANNRLITGSGSANTLEGEASLTFDNTNLLLDGKILKFANVSSTPSASGNVHIYAHDTKLKMCGGSGIQFEEGGFTRWHITSGALHPHGTTYNNLGNSSNRVGNAYIQTSVDLVDNAEIRVGTGDDLKIYHDGTHNYLNFVNGALIFTDNGTNRAYFHGNDGHFLPWTNNTYDLGSSSNRWRNVYTNDLNLSNEGSTNSIDNTWGNYTIQEGESDLFLINNRNGKKYKFNLTEVL